MAYRKYYNADPYELKARFNSKCAKCGLPIKKGADIIYYPNGKKAYHKACAWDDYRRFLEEKFDEDCMVNRSL